MYLYMCVCVCVCVCIYIYTHTHTSVSVCSNSVLLFFFHPQAFSKKKTDDRKEWLTNFMEDRRQRRMHGLPEVCGLSFAMMKQQIQSEYVCVGWCVGRCVFVDVWVMCVLLLMWKSFGLSFTNSTLIRWILFGLSQISFKLQMSTNRSANRCEGSL